MKLIFTGLITLLLSPLAVAMPVETDSIRFEVPDNWVCNHKEIHVLCRPAKMDKKSIIAIVSSYASKKDENLDTLKALFNKPKNLPSKDGTPSQSKVYYTKELDIKGVKWVNSLHFASEIPNYYTQYVATTNQSNIHLLNISAHRDAYKQYLNDISVIMYSMQLKYSPNESTAAPVKIGGVDNSSEEKCEPGTPGCESTNLMVIFGGALVLLALGALGFKRFKS